MKHAAWIAVILSVGLLPATAQRASMGGLGSSGMGTVSTGGLGHAGAFVSPGAAAVLPSRTDTGRVHVGSFGRRHFQRNQVFLFGSGYPGFYGYDDSYPGPVVYENPPRQNSLPQPSEPVFEAHVPAAPLIIEKVGDQWVRRRVVEANDARRNLPQFQDEDEGEPSPPQAAWPCQSGRDKKCPK